jgi:hypothetical protein
MKANCCRKHGTFAFFSALAGVFAKFSLPQRTFCAYAIKNQNSHLAKWAFKSIKMSSAMMRQNDNSTCPQKMRAGEAFGLEPKLRCLDCEKITEP